MSAVIPFRQDERSFVDQVEDAFIEAGATATYREVQARWVGFRSDKRVDGRIDMVVIPPKEWAIKTGIHCLAVEAKDTPGTGDEVLGSLQARSAVLATELFVNGHTSGKGNAILKPKHRLPRVSWSLFTTRPWWDADARSAAHPHEDPTTRLLDRILWPDFTSILCRDWRGRPIFVCHRDGYPQVRTVCFEDPR